jgi:hypothetical protein
MSSSHIFGGLFWNHEYSVCRRMKDGGTAGVGTMLHGPRLDNRVGTGVRDRWEGIKMSQRGNIRTCLIAGKDPAL